MRKRDEEEASSHVGSWKTFVLGGSHHGNCCHVLAMYGYGHGKDVLFI